MDTFQVGKFYLMCLGDHVAFRKNRCICLCLCLSVSLLHMTWWIIHMSTRQIIMLRKSVSPVLNPDMLVDSCRWSWWDVMVFITGFFNPCLPACNIWSSFLDLYIGVQHSLGLGRTKNVLKAKYIYNMSSLTVPCTSLSLFYRPNCFLHTILTKNPRMMFFLFVGNSSRYFLGVLATVRKRIYSFQFTDWLVWVRLVILVAKLMLLLMVISTS